MSDDGKIGEFTPEKIEFDKLSQEAKMCFCVALAAHEEAVGTRLPNDVYDPADGHTVLLVINGRQFSFDAIIGLYARQYDEQVMRAARRLAEERVTMSPVVDRLHRLSYEIDDELDRLFPGTKTGKEF